MADAKHSDTVEWQASANGGTWRRIDPPKGETLQQRIDYLRGFTQADGSPTYRIRCMVAETPVVAAASDLLEALRNLEVFMPRDGENANDTFERVAEAFHSATGYLRPGKDCWVNSIEERTEAWDAWIEAARADARAAIAKATGSAS